jgi:hypothetical protein
MHRMSALFLVLGLLLVQAGRVARAADRSGALETEPSLARPVSVEAVSEPLGDLLPRLGRSLGVTLEASRETQDEKVTLFAKERPAREILGRLAEFFDYSWVRRTINSRTRLALTQDLAAKRREVAQRTSGPGRDLAKLRESLDGYVARMESPEAKAMAEQPPSARLARYRELDVRLNGTWERDENGTRRRDPPMLPREERERLQREQSLLYEVTPEQHEFEATSILRTLYLRLAPPEREVFWAGRPLRLAYPAERDRSPLTEATAYALVAGGLGHLASPADAEPDVHVPFHSFQRVRVSIEVKQDKTGSRVTVNLRVLGRFGKDDATSRGVEWTVHEDVDTKYWGGAPDAPPLPPEVKALSQPITLEPAKWQEPMPGTQTPVAYFTLEDLLPQIAKQVDYPLIADAYTESRQTSRLPASLPLAELLARIRQAFWRGVNLDRGFLTLRHAAWADQRAAEPPVALVRRCRQTMKRLGMLRFAESMEVAGTLSPQQIDTLAWALHEEMPPLYHNEFLRDFEESGLVYRLLYALPPALRKQLDRGAELQLAAFPPVALAPLREMIVASAGSGYEDDVRGDGSRYQLGTGFQREDLLERVWMATRVRLARKPSSWAVTKLGVYSDEEEAERMERGRGYVTDPRDKPRIVQGDEIEVTFTVPGAEPISHSFVDPKQVAPSGSARSPSPDGPR